MSRPLGWEHQQLHSSGPSFVTWRGYCGSLRLTTHWQEGPRHNQICEHFSIHFGVKITKVSTVQLQTSYKQTPLHWRIWGALLSGGNLQHGSSGGLVKRVICKASVPQPCLQILWPPKDAAVAHYLHFGKKVFRSKKAWPKWCIAFMHELDKSLKNRACTRWFSQLSVRSAFSAKSVALGYSWFKSAVFIQL